MWQLIVDAMVLIQQVQTYLWKEENCVARLNLHGTDIENIDITRENTRIDPS